MWLNEVKSFNEIPQFAKEFLNEKTRIELLFKLLNGEPNKNLEIK